MADETKTVILEFQVDEQDAVESINSLAEANKKLRKERNELNIATEAGKKKAAELNAQIDNNTEKIKANVSALEKQKINIGNYASALDRVLPGLGSFAKNLGESSKGAGGFSAGLKAMTSGIYGAVKASLAFIATGIGAIIAGVGLALAAVAKYLTSSEEGMDKFARVSAQASAVIGVLFGTLKELGGALVDIFSGNFTKGIERATKAFDGMGNEIVEATTAAGELADIFDTLEELQLNQQIRNDELSNQVKNLIIQSKNRALTEKERFDLLDKAAKLEKQITGENLALKLADINASTKQLLVDEGRLDLEQKIGETTIDFAKRVAKEDTLLLAGRKAIADKLGEYNGLLDNQRNVQEKIQNQQDALAEKELANRQKQIELAKEQAEQERAIQRAKSGSAIGDVGDPTLELETKRSDEVLDIRKRLAKDIQKLDKEQAARAEKNAEGQILLEEMVAKQKYDAAFAVSNALLGLLDQQSSAYKAIATAQALVSTYTAATKAYEAAFLPIPTVASPALGVAFAAAAVLQGLGNVARINGVEFAEGGWTGPGRKWDVAGVVHADEYVVPKRVVNNPIARHHVSALEQMRLAPYADGGFVANSISNPINQTADLTRAFQNIEIALDVTKVTKAQKEITVKQKISKRG